MQANTENVRNHTHNAFFVDFLKFVVILEVLPQDDTLNKHRRIPLESLAANDANTTAATLLL